MPQDYLPVLFQVLIALGFGGHNTGFVMGPTLWWTEAPWLGQILSAAVVCLTSGRR